MTRSTALTLTVIYWRDIPAQVIVTDGRTKHRVELTPRFQQAIDRAAMHTGRIGPDEYLDDWKKQKSEVHGDPQEAAETAAAELEDRYPPDALNDLVENGGFEAP
jgi:hypothetical protein